MTVPWSQECRNGTPGFAPLGFEVSRGIAIAHSGTLQWIDPLIGVRLRHQFTPSQQIFVRGDLGGFGLQSQFTWQAVAAYSYSWQLNRYQLAGTSATAPWPSTMSTAPD